MKRCVDYMTIKTLSCKGCKYVEPGDCTHPENKDIFFWDDAFDGNGQGKCKYWEAKNV